MSYCRGIIYVVQNPNTKYFNCWSRLHKMNEPNLFYTREDLIVHLRSHMEDADEIQSSVTKAIARLEDELKLIGNTG